MRVRKRSLPPGWYPAAEAGTREAIQAMREDIRPGRQQAVAGVAPHAGWEYSGALALAVFSRIVSTVETLVIIGGHLGPSDGILAAFEDGYETPLGVVEADQELLTALRGLVEVREDRSADNTVEVHLPLARQLFPRARALGLRAAPSKAAADLGAALARISRQTGRVIAAIGSTDLTHYGPNYGFLPAGRGEAARRWVREVNDRRFIESLLAMDWRAAVDLSLRERSACSAGGAVAAMSFARAMGCREGRLVEYRMSCDVHPGESFVGYAAVVFPGLPDTRGA